MPTKKAPKKGPSKKSAAKKRSYLRQSDIPKHSLEEALRVPRAIVDNYAGDPTPPLKVAAALDLLPGGSEFKMLSGAAIAYGLVSGGSQAKEIAVESLGKRILKPLKRRGLLHGQSLIVGLSNGRGYVEFGDERAEISNPADVVRAYMEFHFVGGILARQVSQLPTRIPKDAQKR